MISGKQRAQLRGLANGIDTIVQIGKGGITENVVKQVDDALNARELIKGRVLENSLITAREAGVSWLKSAARSPFRQSAQNLYCTERAMIFQRKKE